MTNESPDAPRDGAARVPPPRVPLPRVPLPRVPSPRVPSPRPTSEGDASEPSDVLPIASGVVPKPASPSPPPTSEEVAIDVAFEASFEASRGAPEPEPVVAAPPEAFAPPLGSVGLPDMDEDLETQTQSSVEVERWRRISMRDQIRAEGHTPPRGLAVPIIDDGITREQELPSDTLRLDEGVPTRTIPALAAEPARDAPREPRPSNRPPSPTLHAAVTAPRPSIHAAATAPGTIAAVEEPIVARRSFAPPRDRSARSSQPGLARPSQPPPRGSQPPEARRSSPPMAGGSAHIPRTSSPPPMPGDARTSQPPAMRTSQPPRAPSVPPSEPLGRAVPEGPLGHLADDVWLEPRTVAIVITVLAAAIGGAIWWVFH